MSTGAGDLIIQFKATRRAGVPAVAILTADPPATVARLAEALNGKAPVITWDLIEGLRAVNEAGQKALAGLPGADQLQAVSGNPAEALTLAARLPEGSCLFFHNAHRFIGNEAVSQAVCNLREPYKASRRTLVLLAPELQLPVELQQDVVILDEPLPGDDALGQVAREIAAAGEVSLDDAQADKAVDALRGLSAFAAEQAAAMSLTKTGFALPILWERKRRAAEQTRGLSFDRGGESFTEIGGLGQIQRFAAGLFSGPGRPTAVVRIDEIEKALAGAGGGGPGDSSGVSQDALGVILREMEDQGWTGILAVGHPGTGKSLVSKAMGNTYDVPTLALDLGAVKGSLIGQSEQQIREAMKRVKAIAGAGAFFVGTCNALDTLPPALRRRFRLGIWFFDLPDAAERESIWRVCLKRYGLGETLARPADDGWTGADIRNCCDVTWRLDCAGLAEAAEYLVPVAKADPDGIERLRRAAAGRFLSASYPGAYRLPGSSEPVRGRAIQPAAEE